MLTSQTSNSLIEPKEWMQWAPDHAEVKRVRYSTLVFDDRILFVGGLYRHLPNDTNTSRAFNLVLIDPPSKKFQIIKSTGAELDQLCWPIASACYWKDSKIVVFGGWDFDQKTSRSDVAIVTLKDLDSETPSAHWERFHPQTQHPSNGHSACIYQNRMLVLSGRNSQTNASNKLYLYLNLDDGSWKQVSTPADYHLGGPRVHHNNKVYGFTSFEQTTTITVFDFDALTWDNITGPQLPTGGSFVFCNQLVDGKIYFAFALHPWFPENFAKAEPWVLDLSSKILTQIPASNFPFIAKTEVTLRVAKNQLILCGGWVGKHESYGEILSFPLDSTKPSEVPLKSATILSNTQQIMLKLLQEAPYSDISFEVEGNIIAAHKWWLCKKSKYFANMFASGMVEAQASRIKIPDMTASTFKAFLQFLYADHVELNNTLALELLQQADKYSVPELAKACEKYLAENLSPENYMVVSQMAEMLDIVLLREAVVNYIAKNVKQLKTRKDFEDISDSILRESIVKFIVK